MYIDTLVRIKNALLRKKEKIKIPYSRLDENILLCLVKHGYLEEIVRKGRGVKRIIEIKLKYGQNEEPSVSGIKILSRSSKRVYLGWKDIRKSREGYGNYFFSTPKGIMAGFEARNNKVGGEALFEIW